MMDQLSPEQVSKLRHEDRGPLSIRVVVVFTVIAFICVSLRFFTRLKFVRNVGLEDYLIAVSMVFSTGMGACQIMQVKWGNGKHAMFITSLDAVQHISKYLFWSIIAYNVSLTLTKFSILWQYRRIFAVKKMRLPIYIVMGIVVAYGIETFLTGTFTCIPVDAFWNLTKKPTAKCLNENALYFTNGALNILTDLLVAALPVKVIWDLKLPRKQKIALLTILTIGWFVCIVSILRLHSLVEFSKYPDDSSWHGIPTAYWSAIEVNLGIVCASTPALKPLVARVIPRFNSTHRYGTQTKESKTHSTFIELKGMSGNGGAVSAGSRDLERAEPVSSVTALPAIRHNMQIERTVHISRDVDQYSERIGRNSDSGSQQNLVTTDCRIYAQTPTI